MEDPNTGAKVFIDSTVLTQADKAKPPYMTRTAWINHLVEHGLLHFRRSPYGGAE